MIQLRIKIANFQEISKRKPEFIESSPNPVRIASKTYLERASVIINIKDELNGSLSFLLPIVSLPTFSYPITAIFSRKHALETIFNVFELATCWKVLSREN